MEGGFAGGNVIPADFSTTVEGFDPKPEEFEIIRTNIVKANIWLTDIKTWAEMNEAWDAWVVPGQTPARATVESKLAAPGYDVEIMVEAAI